MQIPGLHTQTLRVLRDKLVRRVRRQKLIQAYEAPTDIMSTDWDNLIILDACRFDIFQEESGLPGKTEWIISKASKSREFCQKCLKHRTFHDTVYVTTNPPCYDELTDEFHKIASVLDYNDEEHHVGHSQFLSPKRVRDLTVNQYQEHPNKRYVIHFMQPHDPYFGSKAEQLRSNLREDYDAQFRTFDKKKDIMSGDLILKNLIEAAMQDLISAEELKSVYRDNLRFVLTYVSDLHEKLGGKTVVTADHGELLGEEIYAVDRRFGHPDRVYSEILRRVPYHIMPSDTRRHTYAEAPTDSRTISDETVQRRLRSLGYVD